MSDDCKSGSADVDVRHTCCLEGALPCCLLFQPEGSAYEQAGRPEHAGRGCSLEAGPEAAVACVQDGWLAGTDVVHRERLQALEANVLLLESSLGATHPQASCLRHPALACTHVCLWRRQIGAASLCVTHPELGG